MGLLKKEEKKLGTLLLIIAFLILSIIIPFIQSRLKEIDNRWEESKQQLIQAEMIQNLVFMQANFGNLLSLLSPPNDTAFYNAIKYYRNSAKKELISRLALLHVAFYGEFPTQQQLDKWNSMKFEELENEVGTFWRYRVTWDVIANKKIQRLTLLSYFLYGFSLICYSIGLYLVNIGSGQRS